MLLLIPEYDTSPAEIVRAHFNPHFVAGQNPDIIHPHFAGNRSQDFMAVFQLYLKHSIAQRLQYRSVLLDECLLRHNFGLQR